MSCPRKRRHPRRSAATREAEHERRNERRETRTAQPSQASSAPSVSFQPSRRHLCVSRPAHAPRRTVTTTPSLFAVLFFRPEAQPRAISTRASPCLCLPSRARPETFLFSSSSLPLVFFFSFFSPPPPFHSSSHPFFSSRVPAVARNADHRVFFFFFPVFFVRFRLVRRCFAPPTRRPRPALCRVPFLSLLPPYFFSSFNRFLLSISSPFRQSPPCASFCRRPDELQSIAAPHRPLLRTPRLAPPRPVQCCRLPPFS